MTEPLEVPCLKCGVTITILPIGKTVDMFRPPVSRRVGESFDVCNFNAPCEQQCSGPKRAYQHGAFSCNDMSIRLMTRVWDLELGSHTEKLVLLALADNANDDGVCWPSIGTLAEKCNLTGQGVRDQIHKFQALGLIEIQPRSLSSNIYLLKIPEPEWRQTHHLSELA